MQARLCSGEAARRRRRAGIIDLPAAAAAAPRWGARACVTPERSILKRLTDQLPVEMALTKPLVMMSSRIERVTSYVSRRVLVPAQPSEHGVG